MKYLDSSLSPEVRAEDLLSRMTLEEKVAQLDIFRGVEFTTKPHKIHNCSLDDEADPDYEKLEKILGNTGIGFMHDAYTTPMVFNKYQKFIMSKSRFGIPCIFTGEALHGISWPGAMIFPVPLCLAASFNRDIVNRTGKAIGAETRSIGIHEILAPNLDVAREPRWGRVEETFGEDTYLCSQMGYQIITGEQKNGEFTRDDAVLTEPKHYCVHGIAENGINCANARAGKREIEQCYLPVFETAIVKAGAKNVMACYNAVDGEVVISSKHYLTDVLRGRFGMEGYVRADWGAIERLVKAHRTAATHEDAICDVFNAGMDMQGCSDYSNEFWQNTIIENVKNGRISEEKVNKSAYSVLLLKFKLGLFENPYADEEKYKSVIRCDEHKNLAYESAKQGMTLIENNGILPLDKNIKKIALVGPSSARQRVGGYSSIPYGYEVRSVYDELKDALGDEVEIYQNSGCGIPKGVQAIRAEDGQHHLVEVCDEEDESGTIEDAVAAAQKSDVIIFVGGDNTYTSGEGHDRSDLRLPGRQRELILELAKTGKPLVVVLENGRSIDLSAECGVSDAILISWFGGEFGAKAIVDTLLGKNNPAGRLPVSFPADSFRIPCYYSRLPNFFDNMFEGDRAARYHFGYGLSYTKFEYSDLVVEKTGTTAFKVSVNVKNIGDVDGDEVVQLYVNDVVSSVVTPLKLLQGFERISLKAGETKSVEFNLGFDAFRLLNKDYEWVVEDGDFEIMVGAASDDIRLKETVNITNN
jgi:beta-glucosidase